MSDGDASSAWVHDLDPWLVELWEGGPIRWYGLAYLAGFLVAYLVIRRVLKAGASPLPPKSASDLVFALALGAVVGARVGYVLFYQPRLLWTFEPELPFWGALAIHEGGMSSHGGMLGVVVAALVFARLRGAPFAHVLDLAAFGAPLGLFFGRLANFVNGELYGRPAPEGLPWAVKFPTEALQWDGARLAALKRAVAPVLDDAAAARAAAEGVAPVVIERIQQGDAAVKAAVAPLLTARHPSQIYEALLEGALVFVVLALVWRAPRRPGIVAATFALVYGVARIVVEAFRQPDAHIAAQEYALLHVTRGQWLSALLVLAGGALLLVARRRDEEPLGGWASRR